jgi:hypothetical protein
VTHLQPSVANPTAPNPESVETSSPRVVVDLHPTTLRKKSSRDNTKENLPLKDAPTAPETIADRIDVDNTTLSDFTRPYPTIADENLDDSHSNTVRVLPENITHPSSTIPDKDLEESYSNTVQVLAESSNLPLQDISAQIIVSKVNSSAFCMI